MTNVGVLIRASIRAPFQLYVGMVGGGEDAIVILYSRESIDPEHRCHARRDGNVPEVERAAVRRGVMGGFSLPRDNLRLGPASMRGRE